MCVCVGWVGVEGFGGRRVKDFDAFCLSVASHISETSEVIAIIFDTVAASGMKIKCITC